MIKILKKSKWLIKNLLIKLLGLLLHYFIPRSDKFIVFNTKMSSKYLFLNNTKYLYLYLNEINDFQVCWLCDNANMIKTFHKCGYKNVYSEKSLYGIYHALKSKYWFYDYTTNDLPGHLVQSAVLINLCHGIPLKKINYDASDNYTNTKKIFLELFGLNDNFCISNCEYERSHQATAFLVQNDNLPILGSPRLDVLYRDIAGADLFMEEDFENIKHMHEQGKNLIIYMPTFRDTGKNISGWLKSNKLREFLKNTNSTLICKLHPYDNNSLDFETNEEIYKMANDSDVYPILKYTDSLITDYSSVYFDYLLLDKPILYYPIDLEEYQEKCRGFYRPYEELTAGVKSYNEEELIQAMQDVINGVDNYKEERKILRDKMFKYQDGRNCERVVEWIKGLDK